MQLKKSLEENSNSENSSENTNSEENAKPVSRVVKKTIPIKRTSAPAAAKPVVSDKPAEVSNNVFDIPDYE